MTVWPPRQCRWASRSSANAAPVRKLVDPQAVVDPSRDLLEFKTFQHLRTVAKSITPPMQSLLLADARSCRENYNCAKLKLLQHRITRHLLASGDPWGQLREVEDDDAPRRRRRGRHQSLFLGATQRILYLEPAVPRGGWKSVRSWRAGQVPNRSCNGPDFGRIEFGFEMQGESPSAWLFMA